jgi:hypothetical protein
MAAPENSKKPMTPLIPWVVRANEFENLSKEKHHNERKQQAIGPHVVATNQEVHDGATHNTASAAADLWISIMKGEVPPRVVNPETWATYSKRLPKIMDLRRPRF